MTTAATYEQMIEEELAGYKFSTDLYQIAYRASLDHLEGNSETQAIGYRQAVSLAVAHGVGFALNVAKEKNDEKWDNFLTQMEKLAQNLSKLSKTSTISTNLTK